MCTPRNPLGATMVSSEGACAAYYLYRRLATPPTSATGGGLDWLRQSTRQPLDFEGWTCPVPLRDSPDHRDGARRRRCRCPPSWSSTCSCRRSGPARAGLADSAVVELGGARIAFSTDTFVVRPLFFPGGSIGDLAVNGTVNDLAMSGAHAGAPVLRVRPGGGHRARRGRPGRDATWARPRAPPASRSSPATPRSSTPVTATRST